MDRNIPQPTYWSDDYNYDPFTDGTIHYKIATCPNCKQYPIYGENPCPYCGQALILPKIDDPEPEIKGGVMADDGKIHCKKCGDTQFHHTSHTDGVDFHEESYTCKKCGNELIVSYKQMKVQYII
jgi:ribosomal protein S27AE